MISFIACKSDDPDMPVSKDPLTFTASGTVTAGIYNTGKFYEKVSLEYKINDGDWAIYEIDQDITLNDGDRLSFQAGENGNKCMGTPDYTYLQFKAEGGKIAASGNIMSLLDRTMKQTAITEPYCFFHFFSECGNLTSAPELPATTLAPGCYRYMFKYCSVTTAPKLPAKVLEESCYEGMFYDCNLTTAPELPAKALVKNCYAEMFFSNDRLNHITMLAEDINADNCLNRWVSKVNSSGTFVKSKSAKWDVSGENGIPEGWEVQYK